MILKAREERYKNILKLSELNPEYTIIVLKTNTPGPEKNNLFSGIILKYFNKIITSKFSRNIRKSTFVNSFDGDYYYYIIENDFEDTKKSTIYIEENEELGRLVDIDVYYQNESISRKELNYTSRKCLICDNDAFVCSRNSAHSLIELQTHIIETTKAFFTKYFYELSIDSMYKELNLHPKFGLVSFMDSGSHIDMNYHTFLVSIEALKPYIMEFITLSVDDLNYKRLQSIGLNAEKSMFKATNNINTHKGLIFLLGIFVSSAINALFKDATIQTLRENIKKIAFNVVGDYYDKISDKKKLSNADKIFRDLKIKGVREEALNGLSTLFDNVQDDFDDRTRYINYLIYYMSKLNDTTVIHKTDLNTLIIVKNDMQKILSSGGFNNNISLVKDLSEKYKRLNISPGGSADMLVLSILLENIMYLYN
ncbi:citrate lyase holo-[acyl-carrier protein] synthase [Candidatus Izimaplasma bacterium ZiA1]|uniref:citrate lyase holo-[acyl-carrier protein] synthase n=1 Tax=Candidatus Izimoplasma sp. ZiA1 TaxID=2024899 RepID=UPI000BAA484D|nr:citrate lyase holo-[acyl-carrier protein] synthase [Candidatus Izimaplasma bacterium ZiA1]